MTLKWDPSSVWQDLEADGADGTSAVYGALLSKCPVAYIPAESVGERGSVGYWGIFAYDELTTAATNHKTFSNVTPLQGPRILPLQSDPPEHAGYRRMLNQFFTADEVAKLEREVRSYGGEMLDALITRGSADFAQEFAYPFPTRVLCTFLRVPSEDWQVHHDWVMEMEHATGDGLLGPTEAIPPEVGQKIMPYLQKVIGARRANLSDDVISGIIKGEIEGRQLDEMAVTYLVITIMLAGHITTTSAVGNFVLRLAHDAELQSFLRANPDRIPDAVEESLRLDTPQQAMPRRCLRDTDIGGETIKEGEYVIMNFGSANVDPHHWTAPEKFDLDRADKRHVAFGRGVHLCIGQHLARMEMRVVGEELLARTESFEVSGAVRRTVWPRMAVDRMPLSLTPRAAH